MCGIIGYKGNTKAASVVIEGLKNLEYRGYDSWGIACKSNPAIAVQKKVGRIGELSPEDIAPKMSSPCAIAIGHTRWATHGGVTQANAHPHLSEDGQIAVVHNGIIENFDELKSTLQQANLHFVSETDTEVIPQLIHHYTTQGLNFKQAFVRTLKDLKGSFAIAAIDKNSDEILFGRRGSPLVIGIGTDEYFVASDIPAFLKFTNKVIYVNDDEYGAIGNSVEIFRLRDESRVQLAVQTINWTVEQAEKGNYSHFMLKEIIEQKHSIQRAVEQDDARLQKIIDLMRNARGIFFVGCGTSYHACISASYQFSHAAKTHVNVVLGSEFRNYEEFLTDKTLMIAVSQSGETADLLDAVKVAKQKGVKVVSIVNVMGSSLPRMSDESILMNAGPEICVCSTKSYTSQLAILLLLAYGLAGKLEEGKSIIKEAAAKVEGIILDNSDKIRGLVEKFDAKHNCFLIGRDLAHPSALEGALKIKEVSYIHAEGFAGGELKHGTIALIEQGTPVVVLSTPETEELILSNAAEVKSRGGYIIGIGAKPSTVYDTYLHVPDVGQANPLLMVIPVQLLAYHLAVKRGLDPDKPRNLAKSVTVR